MIDLLVDFVAVILTLIVLSRVIGDNPLFRVAQYLFVGVSLGYAFVVVYHQVFRPMAKQLINNLDQPPLLVVQLIPLFLGILLLPRIIGRQRFSWLANIPLGFVFGVGAAVALSGALIGTLIPQMLDTVQIATQGTSQQLAGSVLLAIGVILVLSYFYFTVPQKAGLMRVSTLSARIGHWILMVAFGFFLAGSLLTYLTALSDRFEFIVSFVGSLFGL